MNKLPKKIIEDLIILAVGVLVGISIPALANDNEDKSFNLPINSQIKDGNKPKDLDLERLIIIDSLFNNTSGRDEKFSRLERLIIIDSLFPN